MSSFSLGLKKLIFSKRDSPVLESSHLGRERKRKTQSGDGRRVCRDVSPFEEVEARSLEMTDGITVRAEDRDNRHRSGDGDELGYCGDVNDSETQGDASEFEEIVWQDGEKACDRLEPCGQDQATNPFEKSTDVHDTSDSADCQQQFNDILKTNTHSSQIASPLETQKDFTFEEKISRPQGSEMLSLSDSIQGELDDIETQSKAQRHQPITKEQFWGYFDSDGRIVDENQLKRTIFKGGVEEDIRKDVWNFLFELYPCNSTTREREAMRMEHSIRYDALKARWRPLLKQIEKDPASGVRYCPDWLRKRKMCGTESNFGRQMEGGNDHIRYKMDFTPIRDSENNLEGDDMKNGNEVAEKTGESVGESSRRRPEGIEGSFGKLDVGDDRGRKEYKERECTQQQDNLLECPKEFHKLEKIDIEDSRSISGDDLGLVVNVHGNTVENIRDAIMEAMMEEPQSELNAQAKTGEKLPDSCVEGKDLVRCRDRAGVYDVEFLKDEKESRSINEKVCIDEEMDKCQSEGQFSSTCGKIAPGKCTSKLNVYEEMNYEKDLKYGKVSVNGFLYVREEGTNSSMADLGSGEDETAGVLPTEESGRVMQSSFGPKTDNQQLVTSTPGDVDFRSVQVGVDGPRELENALSCGGVSVVEAKQLTSDEDPDKYGSRRAETAGMRDGRSGTERCEELLNSERMIGSVPDQLNKQALMNESENESCCRRSIGSDDELETATESFAVVSSQFQNGGITSDLLRERHITRLPEKCQTSTDSLGEDFGSGIGKPKDALSWTESLHLSDCHELTGINDRCKMIDDTEEGSNLQESRLETDLTEDDDLEVSGLEEELLALQEDVGLSMRAEFRSGIVSREGLLCETTWEQCESFDEACGVANREKDVDNVTELCKTNEAVSNRCTAVKSEDSVAPSYGKVSSESKLLLKTLEISPIRPSMATTGAEGSSDKLEMKTPFSVSPWLQQQLNASSPAGTKTKRMIRIHEEGLSSIENMDAVVPLREIAEKASLAVQKQLIGQEKVAPRSSTPVEEMRQRKPIKTEISDDDKEMDPRRKGGTVQEESKGKGGYAMESNEIRHRQSPDMESVNRTVSGKFESNHQRPVVEVTGLGEKSQSKGQIIEQRSKVSESTSGKEDSTIDPETGENGDGRLKEMRGRERTSLSSNFDSNGGSSLQRPLDHSRKAFSAANLNDSLLPGNADQGVFNLLKNLDDSISKSDSNVYKADQKSPQLSRFSWYEPHDNETCLYCATRQGNDDTAQEYVNRDLKQYVEIQAKVHAGRQVYDVDVVCKALRIIDKDIPRTDRELEYFKGNDNPNLLMLRDALITYAFFHPDVGYAQGMNDIMSRFFVVMESEADAYWMFCNYMDHFKGDFLESDMLRKISLVEQLLMKMDRELFDFFQTLQLELIFCHRWLLLSFKREFSYEDGLRVFEILSSKHLEVSSVEAEMERSRERARELEKEEGSRMEEIYVSPEYSFDVFVCVSMLQECRDVLMSTNDIASVYQILSNLPKVNDLDVILLKAEDLFFNYCRKSTMDCFQLIDEPIEKKSNWKQRFHLDF